MKSSFSKLKNYADKFEENSVSETSGYVEFDSENGRYVFRKISVCWFLRKDSYKCSSDRNFRVRKSVKPKTIIMKRTKPLKTVKIYKKSVQIKRKMLRKM